MGCTYVVPYEDIKNDVEDHMWDLTQLGVSPEMIIHNAGQVFLSGVSQVYSPLMEYVIDAYNEDLSYAADIDRIEEITVNQKLDRLLELVQETTMIVSEKFNTLFEIIATENPTARRWEVRRIGSDSFCIEVVDGNQTKGSDPPSGGSDARRATRHRHGWFT